MAHWLMKSEPGSYGWDSLVRDGGTEWDGVRNNAARLHLKAMKAGDEAFFYHSMEERAIVGIMRIARRIALLVARRAGKIYAGREGRRQWPAG